MAASVNFMGNAAKSFILAAERCDQTQRINENQIENNSKFQKKKFLTFSKDYDFKRVSNNQIIIIQIEVLNFLETSF